MPCDIEITVKSIAYTQDQLALAGMPKLDNTRISTILQSQGRKFIQALLCVIRKGPRANEAAEYAKAVITAVVPATETAIQKIGIENVSHATLIEAAVTHGRTFIEAVKLINSSNANDGSYAPTASFLRRMVIDTTGDLFTPNFDDQEGAAGAMQDQEQDGGRRPMPEAPEAEQGLGNATQPASDQGAPAKSARNVSHVPPEGFSGRYAPPATAEQGRSNSPQNARPGAGSTQHGAHAANSQGAARRNDQPSSNNTQQEAQRAFESIHLYGGKAAMCFCADQTRATPPRATVRIESAPATGPRTYDWTRKVGFQLTVSELSLVLGVLLGFTTKADLVGHGAENEKSFSIENQADKFYMSLAVAKKGIHGVPVLPKDTILIMGLLYRQLRANMPDVPESFVLASIKRVCEMTPCKTKLQHAA